MENIAGGVIIHSCNIDLYVRLNVFAEVQSRRVYPLGHGTQKCYSNSMRIICSARSHPISLTESYQIGI